MRPLVDPVEISVDKAVELFLQHKQHCIKASFLTGAGISKASGLPTRQDLWKVFNRQDAVSVEGVKRDPTYLWKVIEEFYKVPLSVKRNHATVPPGVHCNDAHIAIDNITRLINVNAIITQNVDGLHQRAFEAQHGGHRALRFKKLIPPTKILEMHGNMDSLYCPKCGATDPRHTALSILLYKQSLRAGTADHDEVLTCRTCKKGTLVPHVVLFGERVGLDVHAEALGSLMNSTCVIAAGTALDVAPAGPLLSLFHGDIFDFNIAPPQSGLVNYWIKGEAEIMLRAFARGIFEETYHIRDRVAF
jgi:NAD-dependent deacetylase